MNQEDRDRRLQELHNAAKKAKRAFEMADARRDQKYAAFKAAFEAYMDALFHATAPEPRDVADRWKMGMDTGENGYDPKYGIDNPRSNNDETVMVDTECASQPSIEAISYHFEVGRAEAEAILAYANSNNDDLNIVIAKKMHIGGRQ